MSKLTLDIPAGQFCADKGHLGCMYDEAHAGVHHCNIFQCDLDKVTIATPDGTQRVLWKCKECMRLMQADPHDKPIEAKRVIQQGWQF